VQVLDDAICVTELGGKEDGGAGMRGGVNSQAHLFFVAANSSIVMSAHVSEEGPQQDAGGEYSGDVQVPLSGINMPVPGVQCRSDRLRCQFRGRQVHPKAELRYLDTKGFP